MSTNTYSFQDVTASLIGIGGSIAMGAGAGPTDEGIEIETAAAINTMTIGADGTGQHSLIADKSGKITVRLLKTSPTNAQLMAMVNFQRTSGATHGQNVFTLQDKNRNDIVSCRQVAFAKIPNLSYGKDAQPVEWTFEAVLIDFLLGS